jgi:hypothetical protein
MIINTFYNHKPIQYFIYYLFFSVIAGGLLCFFTQGTELSYCSNFTAIMLIWHLTTAISMLLKYRVGFYLFKLYLYILYIGFPIGTYVAKWFFAYIREHEIEKAYN